MYLDFAHRHNHDLEVQKQLLQNPPYYVEVVGSKKRRFLLIKTP